MMSKTSAPARPPARTGIETRVPDTKRMRSARELIVFALYFIDRALEVHIPESPPPTYTGKVVTDYAMQRAAYVRAAGQSLLAYAEALEARYQ